MLSPADTTICLMANNRLLSSCAWVITSTVKSPTAIFCITSDA